MISRIPALQALLHEAEEYENCMVQLAVAFHIPLARAEVSFKAYLGRNPHDWKTCYYTIMGGRTNWLDEEAPK